MRWLDRELAMRPFIAGNQYTIADITAQCALVLGKNTGTPRDGSVVYRKDRPLEREDASVDPSGNNRSGVAVPTGLNTATIVFSTLPNIPIPMRCPACKRLHEWKPRQAWVADASQPCRK